MQGLTATKTFSRLGLILACGSLGACNTMSPTVTGSIPGRKPAMAVSDAERDCLGRAMYFESNRSDADGLLAVGTVVMNRLETAAFPGGICAVVGQPKQFATGVLTTPMQERDLQKVAEVTDAVLAGERHPKVGRAMYFHTAGRRYPYDNMHYVVVAGGNAFYEKRKRGAPEPASELYADVKPAAALAYAAAPAASAVADAQAETLPEGPAGDICTVASLGSPRHHG